MDVVRLLVITLCFAALQPAFAQYENRFRLLDHEFWRRGVQRDPFASPEVLDRKTGLVWQRAVMTSTNGRGHFTWEEARKRVAEIAAESGVPWRLPTVGELAEIVRVVKDEKLVDKRLADVELGFTNELQDVWIWSATPHASNPKFAWYVHYNFGEPNFYFREYKGKVRLVRPAVARDYTAQPCRREPKWILCPGEPPIAVQQERRRSKNGVVNLTPGYRPP